MSTSTLTTERPATGRKAQGHTVPAQSARKGGQQGRRPADEAPTVPFHGILAVQDKHAFIRTSGYLAGPDDVHVSLAQVRANHLRPGDAIEGTAKAPRSSREKFAALARVDTVNGLPAAEAANRPEFGKLTPLFPDERLRLDTGPLATRVIDLVAPIGKGQRGLIVSPPKVGKTMVLQAVANAIAQNNPEVHLMVVLIDERPEEVTDLQRSVRGEVVHSTFDRPAQDHTALAELTVERAKRLVEQGHDVVMLLDSITRLGRAYNLAAPSSSRILAAVSRRPRSTRRRSSSAPPATSRTAAR